MNKPVKTLPTYDSAQVLSNGFVTFFAGKVAKIYDGIEIEIELANSHSIPEPQQPRTHELACTMSEFDHVTAVDIQKYIMKTPAKSCLLDPIPTWFIKQNVRMFVPVITQIVNCSLNSGTFPDSLKHAIITPVIKKQSLDPNELKNYRPVSNITYLSKIIEKHAVNNIARYLTDNNLREPLQSTYRPAHSTESALLKVKNDIMDLVSRREGMFFALLDLSTAFETVNHRIMFNRLADQMGLESNVLKWIGSYLSGRTTSVCIDDSFFQRLDLEYGIPQGSIVGPNSSTSTPLQ